jgi:hypothetical protein
VLFLLVTSLVVPESSSLSSPVKDSRKSTAIAMTKMTTTPMTDKDASFPARGGGGDDDVVIVFVDAQYPNKGEAGMVVAEATKEDREGGASVVMTTLTIDMSAAGKGKGGVVGQDCKNGGYSQVMGLEYGAGSGGGGWLQVGRCNNGSNTPHSI